MDVCPCKDCDQRRYKCHSECKNYKKWVKANEDYKSRRKRERELDIYTVGTAVRLRARYERKRKMGGFK